MRFPRTVLFCTLLLFAPGLLAQGTPRRDAQAIAVLHQSLAAMGGVPNEWQAAGTVTVTTGSKVDDGTIRIAARGLDQSREEIQTPDGLQAEVFSHGRSARKLGQDQNQKEKSLEWANSAQSTGLPSVLIAAFLANGDSAFEYVGLEALDGARAHHVRVSNTFASKTLQAHLAEFSTKDVWVDAASRLPLKLAYERREGGGTTPRTRIEVRYTDYRSVSGVIFPFSIERFFNGTPWIVIKISTVSINPGLADAEFKLR